jgi:hypothetical protein
MFIYCTYQAAVANENQQCCHYTDNGYKFVLYGCGTWPVNDRRTQIKVAAEKKKYVEEIWAEKWREAEGQ